MDLLEYISDSKRRIKLAADTKSSPDYLWQIATGRRRGSTDLAKEIAKHSPVTKESLRPDVWPPFSNTKKSEAA